MIDRIVSIWIGGGWVMWPLLVLCLAMFAIGLSLLINLNRQQHRRLSDVELQRWIRRPELAEGELGEIIRYTKAASGCHEISRRFAEVRMAELAAIDQRIHMLTAVVAASPLVGLLGTVFGMLLTFQALAVSGGGKVTQAMADGISQALFPPEIGLCIALPGMFLIHHIRQRRQEKDAFLARLESYVTQYHRHTLRPAPAPAPDNNAVPVGACETVVIPA